MALKPAQYSYEERALLIPLLQDRLIQWKELPMSRQYKYCKNLLSVLLKMQSDELPFLLTKGEKQMICSCLNEKTEDRYDKLALTKAGSHERFVAERNIDLAKDILEKCGYHTTNRHFEFANNFRFHINFYEKSRYEQKNYKTTDT